MMNSTSVKSQFKIYCISGDIKRTNTGNFEIWKLCTCHYTQIPAFVIFAKTTICIYLVLFEECVVMKVPLNGKTQIAHFLLF
jgi:hypothetical protein